MDCYGGQDEEKIARRDRRPTWSNSKFVYGWVAVLFCSRVYLEYLEVGFVMTHCPGTVRVLLMQGRAGVCCDLELDVDPPLPSPVTK